MHVEKAPARPPASVLRTSGCIPRGESLGNRNPSDFDKPIDAADDDNGFDDDCEHEEHCIILVPVALSPRI